jgi:hypothetical protein
MQIPFSLHFVTMNVIKILDRHIINTMTHQTELRGMFKYYPYTAKQRCAIAQA